MKWSVIIIVVLFAAALCLFRLQGPRSIESSTKNVESRDAQHNTPMESGEPIREIDEDVRSLSTIAKEASPVAAKTTSDISHEKMKQLLLRVNSRATALDYLQGMINQRSAASFTSADVPLIEIVKEGELTPAELARYRARDVGEGKRLIAVRIDGILVFHEVKPFPIEMIPDGVLVFLAEDDLERFQNEMLVSTIERSAAALRRAKGSK